MDIKNILKSIFEPEPSREVYDIDPHVLDHWRALGPIDYQSLYDLRAINPSHTQFKDDTIAWESYKAQNYPVLVKGQNVLNGEGIARYIDCLQKDQVTGNFESPHSNYLCRIAEGQFDHGHPHSWVRIIEKQRNGYIDVRYEPGITAAQFNQ